MEKTHLSFRPKKSPPECLITMHHIIYVLLDIQERVGVIKNKNIETETETEDRSRAQHTVNDTTHYK